MKAEFGIIREKQNHLFYKEYTNDKGIFHFHSQIELYFVDEGEMEVIVNTQKKTLKGGEMSVALSYDAHGYRTPSASKSSVLIIPPYLCEDFISAIKSKRVNNPFITNMEAVKKIKSCIAEINNNTQNEITLSGYLHVILGIVMDNIVFSPSETAIEPLLSSQLLFYLDENFMNHITLESLSAVFGRTPGYLSRYFKSSFHVGFNQYLTILRLKHALMLLHENKHSITYCAMESGFNSMCTFYRAFYNEFQCSPKEYLSTTEMSRNVIIPRM